MSVKVLSILQAPIVYSGIMTQQFYGIYIPKDLIENRIYCIDYNLNFNFTSSTPTQWNQVRSFFFTNTSNFSTYYNKPYLSVRRIIYGICKNANSTASNNIICSIGANRTEYGSYTYQLVDIYRDSPVVLYTGDITRVGISIEIDDADSSITLERCVISYEEQ